MFDLTIDPGAEVDLALAEPERAEQLAAALEAWLASPPGADSAEPTDPRSPPQAGAARTEPSAPGRQRGAPGR